MYFQQSDILRGMSRNFLKKFMNIAVKESHRTGYSVFLEGDRASHFFIMLKGKVNLSIGETSHIIYTIDYPGEAFGWSSLVGRNTYSASAECKEPTKLIKFNVRELQRILEEEPSDGLIFFKNLAATIGNRLIQTYMMTSGASQIDIFTSFGSGQVMESKEGTL